MKLGCILYLKITFNIRCDVFSAMGLTSSVTEIIMFLAGFEKKLFKIFAFLASSVKTN